MNQGALGFPRGVGDFDSVPGLVKIGDHQIGSAMPELFIDEIPGDYMHLMGFARVWGDTAAAQVGVNVDFNNDGSANYYDQRVFTSSTTVSAANDRAASSMNLWEISAGTGQTDWNVIWFVCPFYSIQDLLGVVSQSRYIIGISAGNRASASTMLFGSGLLHILNGTSPLTKIRLFPAAGNFVAGSILSLYALP